MGTRHLTAVVLNNDYVVAQYGQWDGYPACAGAVILDFLKNNDLDKLKAQLKKCRWITNEELKDGYKKAGVPDNAEFLNMEQVSKLNAIYPYLSREIGCEILKEITDSNDNEILLKNSIGFAEDSLFCEWGYIVDLDNNTFEVYEGFNTLPLKENERFYNDGYSNKDYYPIKHVKSYNLDSLPEENVFLADLIQEEDETE